MVVTSNDCISAIKEAIKTFGIYHYYDKGPQEVIDISKFVQGFKQMSPKDIANVLNEVAEKNEHGRKFAETIMIDLQDLSDDKWDELMSCSNMKEYY